MIAIAIRRFWLLSIGVMLVSACGFKLAGGGQLPPELSRIHLQARGFNADQLDRLKRRLQQAGAQLLELPDAGASLLTIRLESPPDARLVSGAGSRSVRRVERRLTFNLSLPGAEPAGEKTMVQQRELSFDEDRLLSASEQRESVAASLEQALYNLLVSQLLRY